MENSPPIPPLPPPIRSPPPIPPTTPPRQITANPAIATSPLDSRVCRITTPPHVKLENTPASPTVVELVRNLHFDSSTASGRSGLSPETRSPEEYIEKNPGVHPPTSTHYPIPRTPIPKRAILHRGVRSASQPIPDEGFQTFHPAPENITPPTHLWTPRTASPQADFRFIGKTLPAAPAPTDPLLRIINFYVRLKNTGAASYALASCKLLEPLVHMLRIILKQAASLATRAAGIIKTVDEWRNFQECRDIVVRERQSRRATERSCTWSAGSGTPITDEQKIVSRHLHSSRTAAIAADCETARYRKLSEDAQNRRGKVIEQHPTRSPSTPASASSVPSELWTPPPYPPIKPRRRRFDETLPFNASTTLQNDHADRNQSWNLLSSSQLTRARQEDAALNAFMDRETLEILDADTLASLHHGLRTLVNAADEYTDLLETKKRKKEGQGENADCRQDRRRRAWERSVTL